MADVILRINGKDVNGSEKAFTTYAKLGDTSPIDVELERNNIPKTYRFYPPHSRTRETPFRTLVVPLHWGVQVAPRLEWSPLCRNKCRRRSPQRLRYAAAGPLTTAMGPRQCGGLVKCRGQPTQQRLAGSFWSPSPRPLGWKVGLGLNDLDVPGALLCRHHVEPSATSTDAPSNRVLVRRALR